MSSEASDTASEPQTPPPAEAETSSPTAASMTASPPPAKTSLEPPRLSPRSVSSSAAPMTSSSHPLGTINAARRPPPPPTITSRGSGLNVNQDIQARLKRLQLERSGAPKPKESSPSPSPLASPPPTGGFAAGGVPSNFKPPMGHFPSAPAVPQKTSLAEKRGMKLPGGLPGSQPAAPPAGGRKKPGLKLSDINGDAGSTPASEPQSKPVTMMDKYSDFLDQKTGSLQFKGKAILNSQGVKFSSGSEFSISLDEVDTLDELGKGNYGTVYKVRHSRPRVRRPGLGLAGNKQQTSAIEPDSPHQDSSPTTRGGTSGIVMAMKEIRLELDDAKFAAIIMELDILHRCISPFIVDFYGAFFQEGAVYICMEFMDGGSIDKLYGDGIPENVLRKITLATTMGLKSLKEEHNIIHRDVKPTNILINTKGQVKICDFGVSGNLVASIAKTNIGCQSYMAPERISSGGVAQAGANPGGGTYSVQSDIWSLGLTIIECACGHYPYPPETYNNIFSQLSAIVDGEPPDLPADRFSEAARNFVSGCLNKIPNLRPTYAMLLQHAWLQPLLKPDTIVEEDEEIDSPSNDVGSDDSASTSGALGSTPVVMDKEVADWVIDALEKRKAGKLGKKAPPPLHAAPLDKMPSPGP